MWENVLCNPKVISNLYDRCGTLIGNRFEVQTLFGIHGEMYIFFQQNKIKFAFN
ncbi:hypothetical protein PGB90_004418 [Kerria lacca]